MRAAPHWDRFLKFKIKIFIFFLKVTMCVFNSRVICLGNFYLK